MAEMGAAQVASASLWDPFDGTIAFVQDEVADPGKGIEIPGAIKTFLGIIAIASFPTILVGLFYRDALYVAVAMIIVSVSGLIGADILSKSSASDAWRMVSLARRNGWAFRRPLVVPSQRTMRRSGKISNQMDPLFERIALKVPELVRPRPGQLVPMVSNGLFWGRTKADIPFCMSIGRYDVDATFAAKSIRQDGFGNMANRGTQYGVLMAYGLERDTRVRAALLAEAMGRDSWRDFKTESAQFNNRFKIFIDGQGGPDAEQALLQALTPATQTSLIDLAERYNAQVILDGPTLWIGGFDRVMSDDPSALSQHFAALVEEFATAATAFKRYVE